jgi:hypothetical protein
MGGFSLHIAATAFGKRFKYFRRVEANCSLSGSKKRD